MIISVIGATGKTGREFVQLALENGHQIRAGVHNTHSLADKENLTLVECDATDKQQVEKLLKGSDAIVSLIGHGRKSPKNVQTDAIKAVIEVCEKLKIKRLVSLTGTGVRFDGDKINLTDKILNFSISHIDPARVNDGVKHVEVIKKSHLDWTVIRVLKLTNGSPKKYRLSQNGPTKILVSRAEAAHACLEVIENSSFIKKAPIISNVQKI